MDSSNENSDISFFVESSIREKGEDTDSVCYKGILSDFGKLIAQGIVDFPQFAYSTLTYSHNTEKETKN